MIAVSHSAMVYLVKHPLGNYGPHLYGARYDSRYVGLVEVYLN